MLANEEKYLYDKAFKIFKEDFKPLFEGIIEHTKG